MEGAGRYFEGSTGVVVDFSGCGALVVDGGVWEVGVTTLVFISVLFQDALSLSWRLYDSHASLSVLIDIQLIFWRFAAVLMEARGRWAGINYLEGFI